MFSIKKKKEKKEYRKYKHPDIKGKVVVFDQVKHDKYDIEARNVLKIYLKDDIKDNENIYGEDMIFTRENFPYKYLEVQVHGYWEKDFPYVCPFVYERKMKFDNSTLFICFNKYYSELIMFDRESICKTSSKLKKYDRENVHFVSWSKVMRLKTINLNINTILEFVGEIIHL
jgi:hypothetical protein